MTAGSISARNVVFEEYAKVAKTQKFAATYERVQAAGDMQEAIVAAQQYQRVRSAQAASSAEQSTPSQEVVRQITQNNQAAAESSAKGAQSINLLV